MEGLPKLPGLDFNNRIKLNHHLSHCLNYQNGYRIPRKPPSGIGGDPLKENSIAFVSQSDSTLYDPVLTYGRVKHPPIAPFKPRYVVYDKVVLTFFGFFKQGVPESDKEHYRIRYVNIIYFMEDDTITVIEPPTLNSGFPQGRLVRRGKIPKNISGEPYSWKDLNIGIDIELNGIVFHITNCDEYTTEFMTANGIELNENECLPVDPLSTERMINTQRPTTKTKSDDDKLRRYLEYDGKVLTFNCVLDETDRPFGECMSYKIYYYLQDDTVAVRELKENQEGRDRFPMLLKRTRLPKNWKQQPVTYPSVFLEVKDTEVNEYYQPKDFIIGETIFIYGRKFLLLDCDEFTRKYYEEILRILQKPALSIKFPDKSTPKRQIPTYLGLGTPEDSMASCLNLIPKPPKTDVITLLVNANKYLRFGCTMETAHPEDKIRHFILKFSLADGKISINEPPIRNSGFPGGKYLLPQLIVRPGSDPNEPEYYTPKDFYMGAILTIHSHRFKITSADLYVYRYMKEHPEMFSSDAIDGVRNYCLLHGNLNDDLKAAIQQECIDYMEEKNKIEPQKEQSFMDECMERFKKSSSSSSNNELSNEQLIELDRKIFEHDFKEIPMPLPVPVEEPKKPDYLAKPCLTSDNETNRSVDKKKVHFG